MYSSPFSASASGVPLRPTKGVPCPSPSISLNLTCRIGQGAWSKSGWTGKGARSAARSQRRDAGEKGGVDPDSVFHLRLGLGKLGLDVVEPLREERRASRREIQIWVPRHENVVGEPLSAHLVAIQVRHDEARRALARLLRSLRAHPSWAGRQRAHRSVHGRCGGRPSAADRVGVTFYLVYDEHQSG